MSVIDTLIYDRTQDDVTTLMITISRINANIATDAEIEEYLSGFKGAYNASDLNRVGNAVNYLSQILTNCGYAANVDAKTSWSISDIPTSDDGVEYLGNVGKIMGVLSLPDSTPPLPSSTQSLNYSQANDIEEILYITNTMAENMQSVYLFVGQPMIFSGGENYHILGE